MLKEVFLKTCRPQDVETQQKNLSEIYRLIHTRPDAAACNFVSGSDILGKDCKIVYRHYATLYFVFVVDGNESELGILDLIQVFVEALDSIFVNVCELDIVWLKNPCTVNYARLIIVHRFSGHTKCH